MSEQETPIEDGHDDATDEAKLAGIVEQVRGDLATGTGGDAAETLRQRIEDAGLHLDDVDFAELLSSL